MTCVSSRSKSEFITMLWLLSLFARRNVAPTSAKKNPLSKENRKERNRDASSKINEFMRMLRLFHPFSQPQHFNFLVLACLGLTFHLPEQRDWNLRLVDRFTCWANTGFVYAAEMSSSGCYDFCLSLPGATLYLPQEKKNSNSFRFEYRFRRQAGKKGILMHRAKEMSSWQCCDFSTFFFLRHNTSNSKTKELKLVWASYP